jgi:hypothetical protein
MLKSIVTRWVPVFVGSAALSFAVAGAASAGTTSPHQHSADVTATTHLVNRPDSGGNGNWANDNFTRDAAVTPDGSVAPVNCEPAPYAGPCYAYTASLKDSGSFTTIKGAFTPNQGGADAGQLITSKTTGQMSGYGDFTTFYATAKPDAHLVPRHVSGLADPSYLWPDLFFPSTATVTGVNEATWGYNYTLKIKTVTTSCSVSHGHKHCTTHTSTQTQKWADNYTVSNDDGQGATAGNITG